MRRLLTVTLLISLASNLCMAQQPAYEFPLSGSQLYRLRWGLQEGSADLVPFPPVLGQPVCAQKGSTLQLGIRWNSQHGRLLGWMPLQVVLSRAGTGEVIWQHPYSGSNWLAPDAVYPLRALPDHVEYATLWSEGLLLVWTGSWPLPVGVMPYSTVNTPSEVFVVLDAPKAPMSPAWVNVLRLSCDWASRAADEATAARTVTNALHLNGTYNGGWSAHTESFTDSDETFYVADFILSGLTGQCNDFADFLLCLQTSVGIGNRWVQRSHPLAEASRNVQINNQTYTVLDFITNNLDAAPWGSSMYDGVAMWWYHQFCVNNSGQVWDGCIQFDRPSSFRLAVIGMPREPDYRDNLVDAFLVRVNGVTTVVRRSDRLGEHGEKYWMPTPQDGFIPQIRTRRNGHP